MVLGKLSGGWSSGEPRPGSACCPVRRSGLDPFRLGISVGVAKGRIGGVGGGRQPFPLSPFSLDPHTHTTLINSLEGT